MFTNTINIDLIEVKCKQFSTFLLVCMKKVYNAISWTC